MYAHHLTTTPKVTVIVIKRASTCPESNRCGPFGPGPGHRPLEWLVSHISRQLREAHIDKEHALLEVDAQTHLSPKALLYAFPPVALIQLVLERECQKLTIILVAPH